MAPDKTLDLLKSAIGADGPGSSDFDLNPQFRPEGAPLRPAAVLIAVELAETPLLYLTKRASSLKHHPGQIAFPGGKLDPEDGDNPVAAALREAHEEIGLPPANVEILGRMPAHETITSFSVTPVLGIIHTPFNPVAEPGEVDEVFCVPLSHVLDRANYGQEYRLWRGQRRGFYVVPYGPYYIWGATARMLRFLAERVAQ